jgi:hypothetical protein
MATPSHDGMLERPFACADVFRHPDPPAPAKAQVHGGADDSVPREIASIWKNESNCTVFLPDGAWFTTWGQGSYEGHPDQRIVCSTSRDMGRTWSQPRTIAESNPAAEENIAYGVPFVVPETGRIYVFFFVTANTAGKAWAEEGRYVGVERRLPEHASGILHVICSDDAGATWSDRYPIRMPDRDIHCVPGRPHGWLNHPPALMPTGEVVLPFGYAHMPGGRQQRCFQLSPAEVSLLRCDNIRTETDPAALTFTLLPKGPRGIRAAVAEHLDNPALLQLCQAFNGTPEDCVWNAQELTVVPQDNGSWLGVVRCFFGAPGYTVSEDRGATWTRVQPLRDRPGGTPIKHPMTMCPMAKTSDGRYVLLFTNNDGTDRGAKHLWDGRGTTRNPQWFVVGREVPGERDNAGLVFGEPRVLAKVDDTGETTLKTGISMPQFFERDGRYFVCYNIDKEHILLDEIPADVLDAMTPDV